MFRQPKEEPLSPRQLEVVPYHVDLDHWFVNLNGTIPSGDKMQRAMLHLSQPTEYPKVNLGPKMQLPSYIKRLTPAEESPQSTSSTSDDRQAMNPFYAAGIRIPSQDELKRMKIPRKSHAASSTSSSEAASCSPSKRSVNPDLPIEPPGPCNRARSNSHPSEKRKHTDKEEKSQRSNKHHSSSRKQRRKASSKNLSKKQRSTNSPSNLPAEDWTISSTSSGNSNSKPGPLACSSLHKENPTSPESYESLEENLARIVGFPEKKGPKRALDSLPASAEPKGDCVLPATIPNDLQNVSKRKPPAEHGKSKHKKAKNKKRSASPSPPREYKRIQRENPRKRKISPIRMKIIGSPMLLSSSNTGLEEAISATILPKEPVASTVPELSPRTNNEPEKSEEGFTLPERELRDEQVLESQPIRVCAHENEDSGELSDASTTKNDDFDTDEEALYINCSEPQENEPTECSEVGVNTDNELVNPIKFAEIGINTDVDAFRVPTTDMTTQTESEQAVVIPTIAIADSDQLNRLLDQVEKSTFPTDSGTQTDPLFTLDACTERGVGGASMKDLENMDEKVEQLLARIESHLEEQAKSKDSLTRSKKRLQEVRAQAQPTQNEYTRVYEKEQECEETVAKLKTESEEVKAQLDVWRKTELNTRIAVASAELTKLYYERDHPNYTQSDPEYVELLSGQRHLREQFDDAKTKLRDLEEQFGALEGSLAVSEDSHVAHRNERERLEKERDGIVDLLKNTQEECEKFEKRFRELNGEIYAEQKEILCLKRTILQTQWDLLETHPESIVLNLSKPVARPKINQQIESSSRSPTASPDSSEISNRAPNFPRLAPELVHDYMHAMFSFHARWLFHVENQRCTPTLESYRSHACDVLKQMKDSFPEHASVYGHGKLLELWRRMVQEPGFSCNFCIGNVDSFPRHERVIQIHDLCQKIDIEPDGTGQRGGSADSPIVIASPAIVQTEVPQEVRFPTIRVKPSSDLYSSSPPPLTPQEAVNPQPNTGTVSNALRVVTGKPVVQQTRIPHTMGYQNTVAGRNFGASGSVMPMNVTSSYTAPRLVHNVSIYQPSMSNQALPMPPTTLHYPPNTQLRDLRVQYTGVAFGVPRPIQQQQAGISPTMQLCAVCGQPAQIKCIRCSSITYCSPTCRIIASRSGSHTCKPNMDLPCMLDPL